MKRGMVILLSIVILFFSIVFIAKTPIIKINENIVYASKINCADDDLDKVCNADDLCPETPQESSVDKY